MSATWFVAVMLSLLLLFAAGVRLPAPRAGWRQQAARAALVAGAIGLVLLANVALYRHDAHFDVTRSHAFTPSPETERLMQSLTTDVSLTYFYQKQNPAGRFGQPDEFGEACAFLCSAKAGFITGQNILLDGGAFPGTL